MRYRIEHLPQAQSFWIEGKKSWWSPWFYVTSRQYKGDESGVETALKSAKEYIQLLESIDASLN